MKEDQTFLILFQHAFLNDNNILEMILFCLIIGEVFAAVEFCGTGDLRRFLRDNRKSFRNDLDANEEFTITPNSKSFKRSRVLSTWDLVVISRGISHGMEYLTTKKVNMSFDLLFINISCSSYLFN